MNTLIITGLNTLDYLGAGLLALFLLCYLGYVLLRPEKF